MRIPRLYCGALNEQQKQLVLDSQASRYLTQVLRCKRGYQISVFNGRGLECDAVLENPQRQQATLSLGACRHTSNESPLTLRLALGISKGERMDIAIQKAVELGVSEIIPLHTDYSVVQLNDERAAKRLQHWHGVIVSACEQSGRSHLPRLHEIQTLPNWLTRLPSGECWLLDPAADRPMREQAMPADGVTLLIGPEGGWSETEIALAVGHGVRRLHFGPRILRTETASIAAVTAVQLLWGDLA